MRAWRYSEAFGRRLASAFTAPFSRAQPGTALVTLWENPVAPMDPGHELELAWPELFAALGTAVPYRGRLRQPVWSPAIFSPRIRALGNVRLGSALVLTHGDVGRRLVEAKQAVLDAWRDYYGFAYSSVSSDGRHTDLRVVLPLTRWVSESEHRTLRAWAREQSLLPLVAARLGLATAHPLPSERAGGPFLACDLPGTRVLDPSQLAARFH